MASFVTLANVSMRLEDHPEYQEKHSADYNPFNLEKALPQENSFNHEETYIDEPAIFSTRGGRYPKRPSPSALVIKSDGLAPLSSSPPYDPFSEAVKVVAARLCKDFPLDRKAVLNLSWQRLQYYFDDLDIHHWGAIFLQQVLLCIFDDNRKQQTEMLHFGVHLVATDPVRAKHVAYFKRANWSQSELICYGPVFLKEMVKFMTHRYDMIQQLELLAQEYIEESKGGSMYRSMWCTTHFKQLAIGHVVYPGNAVPANVPQNVVAPPSTPSVAQSMPAPVIAGIVPDMERKPESKSSMPTGVVQSKKLNTRSKEPEGVRKVSDTVSENRSATSIDPVISTQKTQTPMQLLINTHGLEASSGPTTAPIQQDIQSFPDTTSGHSTRRNSASQSPSEIAAIPKDTDVSTMTVSELRQEGKVLVDVVESSQADHSIQAAEQNTTKKENVEPLQQEIVILDSNDSNTEMAAIDLQDDNSGPPKSQPPSKSRDSSFNGHRTASTHSQGSKKNKNAKNKIQDNDNAAKLDLSGNQRKNDDKPAGNKTRKKKSNNNRNKPTTETNAAIPSDNKSSRPSSSMSILNDDDSIISVTINGQRHYSPPRTPGLSVAPHRLQPNSGNSNGVSSGISSGQHTHNGHDIYQHSSKPPLGGTSNTPSGLPIPIWHPPSVIAPPPGHEPAPTVALPTWSNSSAIGKEPPPGLESEYNRVVPLPNWNPLSEIAKDPSSSVGFQTPAAPAAPIWNTPTVFIPGPPPSKNMQTGPEIMTSNGPLIPVLGPPPGHFLGSQGPERSSSFTPQSQQSFDPRAGVFQPQSRDTAFRNDASFIRNKGSRKQYPDDLQQHGNGADAPHQHSHFDRGYSSNTYQRGPSSGYSSSPSNKSANLHRPFGANRQSSGQHPQSFSHQDARSHPRSHYLSPPSAAVGLAARMINDRVLSLQGYSTQGASPQFQPSYAPYNYPMRYNKASQSSMSSQDRKDSTESVETILKTQEENVKADTATREYLTEAEPSVAFQTQPSHPMSPINEEVDDANAFTAPVEGDKENFLRLGITASPESIHPVLATNMTDVDNSESVPVPEATSKAIVAFDEEPPVINLPANTKLETIHEPAHPTETVVKLPTSTELETINEPVQSIESTTTWDQKMEPATSVLENPFEDIKRTSSTSNLFRSTITAPTQPASKPKEIVVVGPSYATTSSAPSSAKRTPSPKREGKLGDAIDPFKLYVAGKGLTDENLQNIFEPFKPNAIGVPQDCKVTSDTWKPAVEGKKFTFVTFDTKEACIEARQALQNQYKEDVLSINTAYRKQGADTGLARNIPLRWRQAVQNPTTTNVVVKSSMPDATSFWQHINRDKQVVKPKKPVRDSAAKNGLFPAIAEASTVKNESFPTLAEASKQEHVRKVSIPKSEKGSQVEATKPVIESATTTASAPSIVEDPEQDTRIPSGPKSHGKNGNKTAQKPRVKSQDFTNQKAKNSNGHKKASPQPLTSIGSEPSTQEKPAAKKAERAETGPVKKAERAKTEPAKKLSAPIQATNDLPLPKDISTAMAETSMIVDATTDNQDVVTEAINETNGNTKTSSPTSALVGQEIAPEAFKGTKTKAKNSPSASTPIEHPPVQTRAKKTKNKPYKGTRGSKAASSHDTGDKSGTSTEHQSSSGQPFSQITTAIPTPELVATPITTSREASVSRENSPSKIGRAFRSFSNIFRGKSPEKSFQGPVALHPATVEDEEEASSVESNGSQGKTSSSGHGGRDGKNGQFRKRKNKSNGHNNKKKSVDNGDPILVPVSDGNNPEGVKETAPPPPEPVTKLLQDAHKTIEKAKVTRDEGATSHRRNAGAGDLTDGSQDAAKAIETYREHHQFPAFDITTNLGVRSVRSRNDLPYSTFTMSAIFRLSGLLLVSLHKGEYPTVEQYLEDKGELRPRTYDLADYEDDTDSSNGRTIAGSAAKSKAKSNKNKRLKSAKGKTSGGRLDAELLNGREEEESSSTETIQSDTTS